MWPGGRLSSDTELSRANHQQIAWTPSNSYMINHCIFVTVTNDFKCRRADPVQPGDASFALLRTYAGYCVVRNERICAQRLHLYLALAFCRGFNGLGNTRCRSSKSPSSCPLADSLLQQPRSTCQPGSKSTSDVESISLNGREARPSHEYSSEKSWQETKAMVTQVYNCNGEPEMSLAYISTSVTHLSWSSAY